MNNKGATLSGWFETIALSVLFVIVLTAIIGSFNIDFSKSNAIDGLDTSNTTTALGNFIGSSQEQIQGGEASFTSSSGLTLGTSWALMLAILNLIWTFLGGGWIFNICSMMHIPIIVATFLWIIYFGSLVFIIIRILFKVNP